MNEVSNGLSVDLRQRDPLLSRLECHIAASNEGGRLSIVDYCSYMRFRLTMDSDSKGVYVEASQPVRTIQTVVVNDQPIPVSTGDLPVLTTIINDKPLPVQITNIPSSFEYKVDQIWSGWWGGWGNNSTLDKRLNSLAEDGWRMIDSRSTIRLWWWFLPRPKVLLFFEREKGS